MSDSVQAWSVDLLVLDRSELKQTSMLLAELETLIDGLNSMYGARVQKVTRMYLEPDDEMELIQEMAPSLVGMID